MTPLDNWREEADRISLARTDPPEAHPRPKGLGTSYAEHEYTALAHEQDSLWTAEGERRARPYATKAHGLQPLKVATEFVLGEAAKEVTAARADYQHASKVLSPYVRQEPWAKLRYWLAWPLLILGDTAGVWSAAVMLGEVVSIAFWQALAAGLAAGCAGLVGAELKDIRLARCRHRAPDSLSDDEQRYHRLFAAESGGTGIVKLICALSFLVMALVAVGVFALRTSVEGSAAGLTFGLLAAGTALASGLLGYSAADEVADLLTTMAKRVRTAERRYLKLAGSRPLRVHGQSETAAASLSAETQARGGAASKRVEALSWRIQRRNPHTLGHGYPPGEVAGPIGRRKRPSGGA
jgi:hypothetical protein